MQTKRSDTVEKSRKYSYNLCSNDECVAIFTHDDHGRNFRFNTP